MSKKIVICHIIFKLGMINFDWLLLLFSNFNFKSFENRLQNKTWPFNQLEKEKFLSEQINQLEKEKFLSEQMEYAHIVSVRWPFFVECERQFQLLFRFVCVHLHIPLGRPAISRTHSLSQHVPKMYVVRTIKCLPRGANTSVSSTSRSALSVALVHCSTLENVPYHMGYMI